MNLKKYLAEAVFVSGKSKDPSTRVGAVIFDEANGTPVSSGYNGHPAGYEHDEWFMGQRALKIPTVIHAEVNALAFAKGSTVGMSMAVWPCPPCSVCAPLIRQFGIVRVYHPDMSHMPKRKRENLLSNHNMELSGQIFGDRVEVIELSSMDYIDAFRSVVINTGVLLPREDAIEALVENGGDTQ